MAFSYTWMQLLPKMFTGNPVGAVQAVQNVLLGHKRYNNLLCMCMHQYYHICSVFCSMNKQHLGNSYYAVGGTTIIKPSPEVARLLGTADCVPAFYRLLSADNQLFYASQYGRVKKRNSYTIGFTDENEASLMFGQIQYFTLSAGDPVAVVKIFATSENTQDHFQLTCDSLNSRLIPVCPLNTTQLVPVTKIKEKCIFISLNNCYIARFTSSISLD